MCALKEIITEKFLKDPFRHFFISDDLKYLVSLKQVTSPKFENDSFLQSTKEALQDEIVVKEIDFKLHLNHRDNSNPTGSKKRKAQAPPDRMQEMIQTKAVPHNRPFSVEQLLLFHHSEFKFRNSNRIYTDLQ